MKPISYLNMSLDPILRLKVRIHEASPDEREALEWRLGVYESGVGAIKMAERLMKGAE